MTTLQKVNLKIYSSSECDALNELKVHPTQICAGIEGGYKGQCYDKSFLPFFKLFLELIFFYPHVMQEDHYW